MKMKDTITMTIIAKENIIQTQTETWYQYYPSIILVALRL